MFLGGVGGKDLPPTNGNSGGWKTMPRPEILRRGLNRAHSFHHASRQWPSPSLSLPAEGPRPPDNLSGARCRQNKSGVPKSGVPLPEHNPPDTPGPSRPWIPHQLQRAVEPLQGHLGITAFYYPCVQRSFASRSDAHSTEKAATQFVILVCLLRE